MELYIYHKLSTIINNHNHKYHKCEFYISQDFICLIVIMYLLYLTLGKLSLMFLINYNTKSKLLKRTV